MNEQDYAQIMEEQDIINAYWQEEESARMYCTKCEINWKFLASDQDEARGEEYFFCPQCKTDHYLISKEEKEKYYRSILTGKVINIETGKEKESPLRIIPAVEKVFDPNLNELYRSKERVTEKQQREDKALNEYNRLFEEGKPNEAQEVYFKILRSK